MHGFVTPQNRGNVQGRPAIDIHCCRISTQLLDQHANHPALVTNVLRGDVEGSVTVPISGPNVCAKLLDKHPHHLVMAIVRRDVKGRIAITILGLHIDSWLRGEQPHYGKVAFHAGIVEGCVPIFIVCVRKSGVAKGSSPSPISNINVCPQFLDQHASHRAVTFLTSNVKGSFPKLTDITGVYVNSQLLDERANDLAEASLAAMWIGAQPMLFVVVALAPSSLTRQVTTATSPASHAASSALSADPPLSLISACAAARGSLWCPPHSRGLFICVVVRSASVFS